MKMGEARSSEVMAKTMNGDVPTVNPDPEATQK